MDGLLELEAPVWIKCRTCSTTFVSEPFCALELATFEGAILQVVVDAERNETSLRERNVKTGNAVKPRTSVQFVRDNDFTILPYLPGVGDERGNFGGKNVAEGGCVFDLEE